MKITWEEKDIQPGLIVANYTNVKKPGITRLYMIGWESRKEGTVYCLISLADGMVSPSIGKKEMLATHLNKGNYCPVTKLVTRYRMPSSVENRLDMPEVIFSNVEE